MKNSIQLQTIFNDIQESYKRNNEMVEKAVAIITEENSLTGILDSMLLCRKSSVPHKISEFSRKLFVKLIENGNEGIARDCLIHLIGLTDSKSIKARKNSLRLINIILSELKDDSFFRSDCEMLQKVMERLFDKEKTVRKEAIKISLKYQSCHLTENLTVQNTLKDVIRYDTCPEMRKIGLFGIEWNSNLFNCILERSMDTNSSVREMFWTKIQQADLKDLLHNQRIYLMKRAFQEREFEAKKIFMDMVREYKIDDFVNLFYCEEPEYIEMIKIFLINLKTDYSFPKDLTVENTNFLRIYYEFIEDTFGRDSLKLLPMNDFFEIFDSCKNNIVVKNLFRLLIFYDIFTENDKKFVVSLIKKLLINSEIDEIMEETILLVKRIFPDKLPSFISGIIKKLLGSNRCVLFAEFAMKHLKENSEEISKLKDAILTEIGFRNENGKNILYWYIQNSTDFTNDTVNLYFSYLPETIEGCVDLVISKKCQITQIESFLDPNDEKFAIPICKLLLAGIIDNTSLLKSVLQIFYETKTLSLSQYLSIFFFEYFRKEPFKVVDIFLIVLEEIEENERIFIDQSIYWISNSDNFAAASLKLMIKISNYLFEKFELILNRKILYNALNLIEIRSEWDNSSCQNILLNLKKISEKESNKVLISVISKIENELL